jgi:hypothetical protein
VFPIYVLIAKGNAYSTKEIKNYILKIHSWCRRKKETGEFLKSKPEGFGVWFSQ